MLRIVDVKAVEAALSPREATRARGFHASEQDPPLVRVLVSIVDYTFARWRATLSGRHKSKLKIELFVTLSRLFEAELAGASCSFHTRRKIQQVDSILVTKGALPFWVFFLNAASSGLLENHETFNNLRKASLELGNTFRMADALADVIEDVTLQRWSPIWLQFAEPHQKPGFISMNRDRQLRAMLEGDAVEKVARQLCRSLRNAMAILESMNFGITTLEDSVLVWVNSWIRVSRTAL
jgi:hypothetical protein